MTGAISYLPCLSTSNHCPFSFQGMNAPYAAKRHAQQSAEQRQASIDRLAIYPFRPTEKSGSGERQAAIYPWARPSAAWCGDPAFWLAAVALDSAPKRVAPRPDGGTCTFVVAGMGGHAKDSK